MTEGFTVALIVLAMLALVVVGAVMAYRRRGQHPGDDPGSDAQRQGGPFNTPWN